MTAAARRPSPTMPVRLGAALDRGCRLLLAAGIAAAGVAAAALVVPPSAGADTRTSVRMQPGPFEIVRSPRHFARSRRRQFVLRPGSVELWRGASRLETLPLPGATATLPRLAEAVAHSRNPAWLQQTGPGIFLLRAALVQGPGTRLLVTAPEVRQLRLRQDPELYIAAVGALGRYVGVEVLSWDERAGRPTSDPKALRPFVLYGPGATLEIVGSRFGYLGSDRIPGGYGVSWRGATGGATNSTFHDNFFGAYTFQARNVVFTGDIFRDNSVYGLDPHDYSTGLRVIRNSAFHNGAHGIVFSVGVTGSVVRGNHSYENGANGIVMHERSDDNVITDNVAERNNGAGIALIRSSRVTVRGNTLRGNRVGVRVSLGSSRGLIEANRAEDNQRGIEVYGGARDTTLTRNWVAESQRNGIVLEAAGSTSRGDTVRGGPSGFEIRSAADIASPSVAGVERGLVVGDRATARIDRAAVSASEAAVYVRTGGTALVSNSRLAAKSPFDGAPPHIDDNNALIATGVHAWLPVAGMSFVGLAVVLQLVHAARNRATGAGSRGAASLRRVDRPPRVVRSPTPVAPSVDAATRVPRGVPPWLPMVGAALLVLAAVRHLTHAAHRRSAAVPRRDTGASG